MENDTQFAESRVNGIVRATGSVSGRFTEFLHYEATGGIVLFVAAVIALIWANSPWAKSYFDLLHAELGILFEGHEYTLSLQHIVNDGLMAIFFLVVGLEVKREITVGELSSVGKAILPVTAALGGMLVPALIYVLINFSGAGLRGWGIPMATDIAFALGILALLGSRIPPALKVFLTALAVADDIGAVLVIAVFYTRGIEFLPLLIAVILLVAMYLMGRAQIMRLPIYIVMAVAVWVLFLLSGVHATIAGILLAFTIPVRARMDPEKFLEIGYARLQELSESKLTLDSMIHDHDQFEKIMELHTASSKMMPPGLAIEKGLHPFVAFFILPLFALFNAGVELTPGAGVLLDPIALGIIFGLVVGKQVGVTLSCWLLVKSGRAALPEGVSWRQIYGVGWAAGIGFTMSLFVAGLAFTDAAMSDVAKIGILTASIIAGAGGYILLRMWSPAGQAVPAGAH